MSGFHLPSDLGYGFAEADVLADDQAHATRGRPSSSRSGSTEDEDLFYDQVDDQDRERRVATHSREGSGEMLAGSGGQRHVKRIRGSLDGRGEGYHHGGSPQYFMIRVSDGENIAKIAGKLAWQVRRNEELTPLAAKGPGAIATAMGVISKARHFLVNDNKDLMMVPSVLEQDPDDQGLHYRDHATIVFSLYPTDHCHNVTSDEGRSDTLVVTNRSKAAKVAGAVAGRARASRSAGWDDAVWLECVGDEAAMIMMLSLVKGRAYLREDSTGNGNGGIGARHVSYRVVVALEQLHRSVGGSKWRWVVKCVLH